MRTRKLEDLLMDYVSSKEKKYTGSYIQSTVKVVKLTPSCRTETVLNRGF